MNELNIILVLPQSLPATSTEAAPPESPLDLEALKDITRRIMLLSDEVSRFEIIKASVVDSLVKISHYLQQFIREREQEARRDDSGVGHPPPAKRRKASASVSGEIRPVPSGSRHQGDHTDTRRSLPPGSSRTYKTERPGRTSREYEATSRVSEPIATARRHEILNSLTSNEFGDFISQLLSASHNINLELVRKLVRTDRTHPINLETAYSGIQALLRLPNIVANVASWEIGSILHRLQTDTEAVQRFETEISLCNYAESMKVHQYKRIMDDCAKTGCSACSSALQAETSTFPCERTQKFIKLAGKEFTNFTPTYLEQVHLFHETCSESSILTTCAEPPSDVRKIVPKAASMEEDFMDSGLPSFSSGTKDTFSVCADATIEAIQYVDGDGGTLVAELIPGLLQYATAKGIPMQHVSSHNYTLIPFREKYHDAIELGHTYNITCEQPCGESVKHTKEYGYIALIKARQNANLAKKTLIVPSGLDASGLRLLVEIYYDAQANGTRLIELGLSFPSNVAPKKYSEALKTAKERKSGVHEFGLEIGESPFLPWELKETLCEQTDVESTFVRSVDHVAVTCIVTNQHGHLNEAHLMIAKSCIPGAGRGLFLRPKPLSGRSRIVIPAGKKLCLFSVEGIGDTDSDYALEREVGGRKITYNPLHYDGQNLGRFVNQAGLLEGLKAMAQGCDVDAGSTGLRIGEVNKIMAQHTNVVYAGRGYTELHIQTRTALTLGANPIELLATYQLPYWILYTLRHHKQMSDDDPIKVCVLWTLLSDKSAMEDKSQYLQGYEIEEQIKRNYKEMTCPFPVTTARNCRQKR